MSVIGYVNEGDQYHLREELLELFHAKLVRFQGLANLNLVTRPVLKLP